MQHLTRNALIASAVVLLHGAALWTLQGGLLRHPRDLVVPVQLEAELETPQSLAQRTPPNPATPLPPTQPSAGSTAVAQRAPRQHGAPPAASHEASPAPAPVIRSSRRHRSAAPSPAAAPGPTAAPGPAASPAPAAALTSAPTPDGAPAAAAAPSTSTAAAAAPAAPSEGGSASGRVELPLSDADYLHNPAPKWPRLSERLGEHGRVLVHVLIGSDGRPRSAQVKQSSGYRRLDDASVEAVMAWRYVPGKRGGVPQDMWVDVPIRWGEQEN